MELIAQGAKPGERWQRRLPTESAIIIGRSAGDWSAAWDRWLSQQHVEVLLKDGRLQVRQLPAARNPIFFRGKQAVQFEVKPGEWFVAGKTVFTLHQSAEATEPDSPIVLQSRTISHEELEKIPYRNAPQRLDVLNRLPQAIASAADDNELFIHLGNILLAGIPRADAVAIVALDVNHPDNAPTLLHRETRLAQSKFVPSRQLVKEAICTVRQSVLHIWQGPATAQQFTLQGNFDWAFCTPLSAPTQRDAGKTLMTSDPCKGWGIYVAGRFAVESENTLLAGWEQNALSDDLKFTELVAAILGSLRQVRSLEHGQTLLSSFLSPGTLRILREADPEAALKPRQADVTVLFCDLRGFSRRVEQSADNLFAVLERVSEALDVMTRNILEHDGVVSDFQGDSAMAFWGWPIAEQDKVQKACLAALGIRRMFKQFARLRDHPLADFRAGIGIATGTVVAGTVGSKEQGKISVFGPVVNLCSRLQDMTKTLRVPILLDESTARAVRETMPRELARCRRLALVKPYGLETPQMVSELLPPGASGSSEGELTDEQLATYEQALDQFLQGDWEAAYKLLHQIPPDDRGKDFLIGYILQHQHIAPTDWNGVIAIGNK